MSRRIIVVGGGWAGLAAAVRLTERGHPVTLMEAAPSLGGRARSVNHRGMALDNGQHILIGAYERTLRLMRDVGVDPQRVLSREPLALRTPNGQGMTLPLGASSAALLKGIATAPGWPWRARASLLRVAAGWAARRFRCPVSLTVAELCRGLHPVAFQGLVEPLCAAALNTEATQASAQTFLRVLQDTLNGPAGSADLLLPRAPLGELLPEAASRWLLAQGARIALRQPVSQLTATAAGWEVHGETADAVVLACPAPQAARLTNAIAPDWAQCAAQLAFEPIATVVLTTARPVKLGAPMVMLPDGPAQFAFDLATFGHPAGKQHAHTFVVSAAAPWLTDGSQALAQAVLAQARRHFPGLAEDCGLQIASCIVERQATFRCTPGMQRPPMAVAPNLWAAGDHVDGPYPSTLEGAVRSGEAAAQAVHEAVQMGPHKAWHPSDFRDIKRASES